MHAKMSHVAEGHDDACPGRLANRLPHEERYKLRKEEFGVACNGFTRTC